MNSNFTIISPWYVKSDDGFTVDITQDGVIFCEPPLRVRFNYDWLIDDGIGLCTSSSTEGLDGLSPEKVRDVLAKTESALAFIGFRTEFFDVL
ncbi:MAG TPA: hypothetical protein VG796_10020 [Verrucomicrobiales bacterium]|jgi:hypothetical protein|nr:hypothetical protein [Verrucomicrobiales bacterium]